MLSWPGWLTVADALPTYMVTSQLYVERSTGKVRSPAKDRRSTAVPRNQLVVVVI